MKRMLVALATLLFGMAAWAQAPAPAPTAEEAAAKKAAARKAKQEMVKGTTEKAATQHSVAPNRDMYPPTTEADKLTPEQRKAAMKGAMGGPTSGAASQIGPSAAAGSAKVDKNAPKVAKPDMSDPKVREAMEKQKP